MLGGSRATAAAAARLIGERLRRPLLLLVVQPQMPALCSP